MDYYQARKLRILGAAQTIIACMMFVFGIISLVSVPHWSSSIACGLWVGIWVGLTGLFCYQGAKSDDNPYRCMIGAMIGFAITGCILTIIMLIIQSIALVGFARRLRCPEDEYPTSNYLIDQDNDECERYNRYTRYPSISTAQSGAALTSLLIILAVVEFFVALASSIYGCNACCCTSNPGQTQHQVAYLHQPGGNMIIISPHSGVHPGTTLQAIGTYPGQPSVLQGGQPQQGYIFSPQVYQAQPNLAPGYAQATETSPGYMQQAQLDPQL